MALFLFAVVEEDVDESAAVAVEDMDVLTTLDAAADVAEASAAAALQAACIFPCFFSIDFPSRKFAVAEEDVNESAAAAAEDMEGKTALNETAVAAEA